MFRSTGRSCWPPRQRACSPDPELGGTFYRHELLKLFENYGELAVNISDDSIYTGALGAALFALRDGRRTEGARA